MDEEIPSFIKYFLINFEYFYIHKTIKTEIPEEFKENNSEENLDNDAF